MASLAAVKLRHRLEAYLGRGLTMKQVIKCEEITINFKPWFPLRYLENLEKALAKSSRKRNWGLFYYPLYAMGKAFRGYFRRDDLIFIRGHFAEVYKKCDLMAGDGFGESDLSTTIFLASECTPREMQITFRIAQTYGLRAIRHLRGIVLRNRAVAIRPHLKELNMEGDQKLIGTLDYWAVSKYPDVRLLRELYETRIRNMHDGKHKKLHFEWDEINGPEESPNGETADVHPAVSPPRQSDGHPDS